MTYKIAEVGENRREWNSSKGGPMISYYVRVEGDERSFELAQKKDTPAPQVGQSLDARIESREHDGKTYYSLKKNFSGPGSNGSQDNASAIQRQWSLKTALTLMAEARERGISVNELFGNVRLLADKLEEEVSGR